MFRDKVWPKIKTWWNRGAVYLDVRDWWGQIPEVVREEITKRIKGWAFPVLGLIIAWVGADLKNWVSGHIAPISFGVVVLVAILLAQFILFVVIPWWFRRAREQTQPGTVPANMPTSSGRQDNDGQSALPLTVSVDPPNGSGNAGTYRFKLHNPTATPVKQVYGKYHNYRRITRPWNRLSGWQPPKVPANGTDLPWGAPGSNTSPIADIGARSSEYLLIGVEQMWTFFHYGPNKKRAYKLYGGAYAFDLEVGSKAGGTPITCSVQLGYSRQRGFVVEIIPPVPGTAPDSLQATQLESPER